jgi:hypothetical protein
MARENEVRPNGFGRSACHQWPIGDMLIVGGGTLRLIGP